MWSRLVVVFLFICLNAKCFAQRRDMCTVLRRSEMTYVLTEAERQQLASQGYNSSYDSINGIYTFTANPQNGVVYLTAHRIFTPEGIVPYSLGVQRTYEYNAPVYPFPSFEENQNAPDGIYSAATTTLDKCGRLWIVDQGIKSISDPYPIISPGLFAYSFETQRITYKYRFPIEFFTKGTVVTTLVTDSSFGCDKMKLILADTLNYSVLVHDVDSGSSWKVSHPTMIYDPNHADFTYENYTLSNLPTGVYSLAITPPLGKSRTRYLMYSSYSGITTYAVPLSIVYNKRLWTQGFSIWRPYGKFAFKNQMKPYGKFKKYFSNEDEEPEFRYIDVDRYFTTVGSDPTHQGQYCDIDLERKLYFCTLPLEGAIYAWKLTEPFSNRKIIVRNKEKFLHASILRVVNNRQGKNEIVLSTSPITQIFLGILKPDPRNYAVFTCPVKEILQSDNVKCTTSVFNIDKCQ